MMSKGKILYRLVAYTDAAGKFSPEAVRNGNEDNFYVDFDLTNSTAKKDSQDEEMQLGEYGMLMVVADGMGGMNAGEVASQIAIDTIKSFFSPSSITSTIVASAPARQRFLEQAITQADKNIKHDARQNSSHEGMGSTIIIAWLYGDELTISWCGDSRAYLFNDKFGIRLISQDHSYVQELVNKGLLTYDQTFDHPQNNIITRSLGDPTREARPESKTLKVGKGDIILLCSDGLSGVLRDRKTYDGNGQLMPEENMEDIIRSNSTSMKLCREALWAAAERSGWYDNVTAILCKITEGSESLWASTSQPSKPTAGIMKGNKTARYIIVGVLLVITIASAFFIGRTSVNTTEQRVSPIDSLPADSSKCDSIKVKDSINAKSKQNAVSLHSEETKSTVQERIKQQSKKEEASDSDSKKGLTKIPQSGTIPETANPQKNTKLTPIKDKQGTLSNPVNPSIDRNLDNSN